MHKAIANVLIALLAATASLAACAKDAKLEDPAAPPPSAAPNPSETETDTPPTDEPQEGTHFAAGMMNAYEKCRAILAADTTEGIATCANDIVEASKTSHASAPEAAHPHIGAVVTAAKALATAPTDDIEEVRLSFGQLSKAIIAMLASAPEAAKNYHIFECPMAKGFNRWAQPTAELSNPYMGEKMGTCGSEVHDHHTGMMDGQSESDGHTGHSH